MASTAIVANGTLFKISISSVYTVVTNVARISKGHTVLELADVSDHDVTTGFRQHILALQDGDEITIEGFRRTGSASQNAVKACNYDSINTLVGSLGLFKIIYPDTPDNTETFTAWVQSWQERADFGQPFVFTARLKIEGPVVTS